LVGIHNCAECGWSCADHSLFAANLVFQDTIERIFVQDLYADIPRGIFLVRGENVLLLGEIVSLVAPYLSKKVQAIPLAMLIHFSSAIQDLDKDDYIPKPYRKASAEEVHALHKQEIQDRKQSDRIKHKKLQELGFEGEHTGEILL